MAKKFCPRNALSLILFLSLFLHQSLCQQSYVGNETSCSIHNITSMSKGYVCTKSIDYSCYNSFLTFKSKSPYDTVTKVAKLFDHDVYKSTLMNGSLFTTPVICSCIGRSYQYFAHYTVKSGDSYEKIAYEIYQGLVGCSALRSQNQQDYVVNNNSWIDMVLQVPLRCACPTKAQTDIGVEALVVYMLQPNDTIGSVARDFGINEDNILEANMLSKSSHIYPLTPLLVPVTKKEICKIYPFSFGDYPHYFDPCGNLSHTIIHSMTTVVIFLIAFFVPIGLSLSLNLFSLPFYILSLARKF